MLADLLAGEAGPTTEDLVASYPHELLVFGSDLGHRDYYPPIAEGIRDWVERLDPILGDRGLEQVAGATAEAIPGMSAAGRVRRIAVLPGDGVGAEVVAGPVELLEAVCEAGRIELTGPWPVGGIRLRGAGHRPAGRHAGRLRRLRRHVLRRGRGAPGRVAGRLPRPEHSPIIGLSPALRPEGQHPHHRPARRERRATADRPAQPCWEGPTARRPPAPRATARMQPATR